MTSWH